MRWTVYRKSHLSSHTICLCTPSSRPWLSRSSWNTLFVHDCFRPSSSRSGYTCKLCWGKKKPLFRVGVLSLISAWVFMSLRLFGGIFSLSQIKKIVLWIHNLFKCIWFNYSCKVKFPCSCCKRFFGEIMTLIPCIALERNNNSILSRGVFDCLFNLSIFSISS